jgi:hypothetical protein
VRKVRSNEGEKETFCPVVAELKGRRDNTSNRMEQGRNQNRDDKSSHSEYLTKPCASPHESGTPPNELVECVSEGVGRGARPPRHFDVRTIHEDVEIRRDCGDTTLYGSVDHLAP